jgi:chaperonin GroES
MNLAQNFLLLAALLNAAHSFTVTSSSSCSRRTTTVLQASLLEGRKIKGDVAPLNNFILVRVADAQEVTDGGILLTGKAKIRKTLGTVVSCGPGRVHHDSGVAFPMPVQAGSGVVYGKYDGTEIDIDGIPHTLIRDDDILVRFEGEKLTLESVEVVNDNVLVEVETKEQTTEGGILIAKVGKADAKPSTGKVVKVGPGRMAANGELMPMEVAAGDTVKFRDFAGNDVEIGDQEYRVVRMTDILAKF